MRWLIKNQKEHQVSSSEALPDCASLAVELLLCTERIVSRNNEYSTQKYQHQKHKKKITKLQNVLNYTRPNALLNKRNKINCTICLRLSLIHISIIL